MSFKKALSSKDFVVMAELPLTPETTCDTMLADASLLRGSVDGYLLTANQYGQPHMPPLVAASVLLNSGYYPIVQLSCRNSNRIALLGELLGARAIGVDTLMLVRGNVLTHGYKPRPKAVMDMNPKDLIATARLINEDEKLGRGNDFLIGTSATVHDPGPDWHPGGLLAKAESGAKLIISQVCLDTDVLRRYMEFLVSEQLVRRLSVIVSVAVFESADLAIWLRDNRRRTIVPAMVIERLSQAGDPAQEGVELCGAIVRQIAGIPGIGGVNFAAVGNLDAIPKVLARAGISL